MFGENLKTLRKQKGFSQEELATRLHVVRQTISKWEKNLSVPDADTLIRLAEILEVSVSELLGEKLKMKTRPVTLQCSYPELMNNWLSKIGDHAAFGKLLLL